MDNLFDNDRPIYIQLVEKLKLEIVSGRLKPGDRIASVRELAVIMKVNPNTMQKALAELEDQGLVYTERTNGKFVTHDSKLIEKIKRDYAIRRSKEYLKDMKSIGMTVQDATKYLQEVGGKK